MALVLVPLVALYGDRFAARVHGVMGRVQSSFLVGIYTLCFGVFLVFI
ncbi:MAG: hypothetical protein WD049_07120 [Candidatus Paceibacterota bacterium]